MRIRDGAIFCPKIRDVAMIARTVLWAGLAGLVVGRSLVAFLRSDPLIDEVPSVVQPGTYSLLPAWDGSGRV